MNQQYKPPPRDIGGLEIGAALLGVCGAVAFGVGWTVIDGRGGLVLEVLGFVAMFIGLMCALRARELENERKGRQDSADDHP